MKIINETRWNTAQLRAIFARCAAEIRRTETSWQLGKLIITCKTQRSNLGCARYNSNTITMYLPPTKGDFAMTQCCPATLAEVFIHEVGHSLGHRHHRLDPIAILKARVGSNAFTIEPSYFDWIAATFTKEAYPVSVEAPRKISADEKLASKLERAMKNLKNATRRLKLATTLFRKRKQKVTYYEKQLALSAAKKGESQ